MSSDDILGGVNRRESVVWARRTGKNIFEVGREVAREWKDDRATGVAAEIAFWVVLSIFPALLVVGSVLGSLETFLGDDLAMRAEDRIVTELRDVLGSDSNGIINATEDIFSGTSTGVLTIGLLLAVFTASRGFAAIVRALDIAYDIEAYRSWTHERVTGFVLAFGTLIIGAAVLTMLVVGPLFGAGSDLADDLGLGSWFALAWDWARAPLAFVVLIGWAATIYHIGPLHHTPWRWDLPGAALAALFWLASSVGFGFYVQVSSSGGNAIYGVVGGVLLLLLWVYVLSLGLILGAELNQVLADRHDVRIAGSRSVPASERIAMIRAWWRRRASRRTSVS
ncbi:MAG: YihY/virulence factor BrkB family protein [Acidimicrobiales bacterium]